MKKITLIVALFTAVSAFAQLPAMGNLTVFSEDGSRFYLELNGERYNDIAQTNVRIEGLPNPYYSCKVVFENRALPVLEKRMLMIEDADGIMQDVTYRIKTNNKGKKSLSFYSFVPVQQNYIPPADCSVYRYGSPRMLVQNAPQTVYTEQVTVQQTGVAQAGIGVGVNGVQLNVMVPVEPAVVTTTTTTTTTTTVTGDAGYGYVEEVTYDDGYGYNDGRRGRDNGREYRNDRGDFGNGRGCRYAMRDADFRDALHTIEESSFDDTRLSTAQEIISSNCMSSAQVLTLVKALTFESNKLNLAKFAYGYCTDKNNYFKVVNAFTFDSSKTELNDYIRQQR